MAAVANVRGRGPYHRRAQNPSFDRAGRHTPPSETIPVLKTTGARCALDCCCLVSIEAAQKAWSPLLWARLKIKFQTDAMCKQRCLEWLGNRSKFHVPEVGEQFDLHQICMLMSKLTTCTFSSAGSGKQRFATKELEEIDRERHLLNIVSTFRQRFVHCSEMLSAKEVLEALLAMDDYFEMHNPELERVSVSNRSVLGGGCRSGEQMPGRPLDAGMGRTSSRALIRKAVCIVQNMCLPNLTNLADSKNLIVQKSLALKLIAQDLLKYMAMVLQPVVKHLQLQTEACADPAKSLLLQPDSPLHSWHDLQGIYGGLKHVFKSLRKQVDADEAERRTANLFREWVFSQASYDVRSEFKTQQEQVLRRLISSFELLVGKHGLRNRLYHVHGNDGISSQYMNLCLQKSSLILDTFASQTQHTKLMRLQAHVSALMSPAVRSAALDLTSDCQGGREGKGSAAQEKADKIYLQLPRATLFGRDNDLKVVTDACVRGKSVILTGDSGLGKTALAVEAAFHLRGVFQRQYIIPATSRWAMKAGLMRVGKLNHCEASRPSDDQRIPDFSAGLEFLKTATDVLLVIDGLQDESLLFEYMPDPCLSRHVVIYTVSNNSVAEALRKRQTWSGRTHCLQALDPKSCVDYLLSLCPKLRSTERFLDTVMQRPRMWLFFEQQTHCCPLSVQLLAKVLLQDDSSSKNVIEEFCSQQISLTKLQEMHGDNRFHRGVVATVRMLYNTLSDHAKVVLIALSCIGRVTCTISWRRFSDIWKTEPCHDSEQLRKLPHLDISRYDLEKSNSVQQELLASGLVSSAGKDSVSIRLTVQKAVLELQDSDAYATPSSQERIWNRLGLSLLESFRRLVESKHTAGVDPGACRSHLCALLPLAESLLDTASFASEELQVRLTVWVARGGYTYLNDFESTSQHYKSCLEHYHKRYDCSTIEIILLTAELGQVDLRLGHMELGVQRLQDAMRLLDQYSQDTIWDPFAPWSYTKTELKGRMDHCLLTGLMSSNDWLAHLPVVLKTAQNFCASNMSSCHSAQLIGPLTGEEEFGIYSPKPAVLQSYIIGFQTWLSGEVEQGMHLILEAALDLCGSDGVLPPESVKVLLGLWCISPTLADFHACSFYNEVVVHLGMTCLEKWLRSLPPVANIHKVPSSLNESQQMVHLYYKRVIRIWRKMINSYGDCIINLADAFNTMLKQMDSESAFLVAVMFAMTGLEGFGVCVIRFFASVLRWHVRPESAEAVFSFLRSRLILSANKEWQVINTRVHGLKFYHLRDKCNLKKVLVNPAYRFIWYLANSNQVRVAIWNTSHGSESDGEGLKIEEKASADQEDVTRPEIEKISSLIPAMEEEACASALAPLSGKKDNRGKTSLPLHMRELLHGTRIDYMMPKKWRPVFSRDLKRRASKDRVQSSRILPESGKNEVRHILAECQLRPCTHANNLPEEIQCGAAGVSDHAVVPMVPKRRPRARLTCQDHKTCNSVGGLAEKVPDPPLSDAVCSAVVKVWQLGVHIEAEVDLIQLLALSSGAETVDDIVTLILNQLHCQRKAFTQT